MTPLHFLNSNQLLLPVWLLVFTLAGQANAQEMEPRAYSNAPIGMNFLLMDYGYSDGALLFDPSVPIQGANAEVDSRWSLLGFMGAGRASNSTTEFSEAPSQVTQDIGFRYQIARRYGFDMGIDIAKGPEEYVWYITAGSAWSR